MKDFLYAFGAGLNEVIHGKFRRPERHDLASLLRVPGTKNYPSAVKRVIHPVDVSHQGLVGF